MFFTILLCLFPKLSLIRHFHSVSALTRPSTVPPPSTVPSAFVPQSQTGAVDDETESKSDLATLQEQLNRLRAEFDNLTNSLYTALGDQLTGLGMLRE